MEDSEEKARGEDREKIILPHVYPHTIIVA